MLDHFIGPERPVSWVIQFWTVLVFSFAFALAATALCKKIALKLGIVDGDLVTIASERGKIEAPAHVTDKTSPGLVFMAFHWHESPVNMLTNAALDPIAKIPEFKVTAVKVILSVLGRAAEDNAFFARLAEHPAEALKEYNLTWEEKAAIGSGDISKIESWVGKLDERLKKWLIARSQQEKW